MTKRARFEGFAKSLGAQYMTVLDLDVMKESITDKTLVIINSLHKLADENNLDYMFNFLDQAAAKNAQDNCACGIFSDNCEALAAKFPHADFFAWRRGRKRRSF